MTRTSPIVYIIDDDDSFLQMLKTVFFIAGYSVKGYLTATAFLDDLHKVECGCVIADLNMPEINGLQLQHLMHERNISIPLIFLSGAADVDSAVRAMHQGAYTFLQKPVPKALLISTVQTAIDEHQEKVAKASPVKAACSAISALSERELNVAKLTAEGLSASVIADKLNISPRTVEKHKASTFTKLNIHNIAELTRLIVLATVD